MQIEQCCGMNLKCSFIDPWISSEPQKGVYLIMSSQNTECGGWLSCTDTKWCFTVEVCTEELPLNTDGDLLNTKKMQLSNQRYSTVSNPLFLLLRFQIWKLLFKGAYFIFTGTLYQVVHFSGHWIGVDVDVTCHSSNVFIEMISTLSEPDIQ